MKETDPWWQELVAFMRKLSPKKPPDATPVKPAESFAVFGTTELGQLDAGVSGMKPVEFFDNRKCFNDEELIAGKLPDKSQFQDAIRKTLDKKKPGTLILVAVHGILDECR